MENIQYHHHYNAFLKNHIIPRYRLQVSYDIDSLLAVFTILYYNNNNFLFSTQYLLYFTIFTIFSIFIILYVFKILTIILEYSIYYFIFTLFTNVTIHTYNKEKKKFCHFIHMVCKFSFEFFLCNINIRLCS